MAPEAEFPPVPVPEPVEPAVALAQAATSLVVASDEDVEQATESLALLKNAQDQAEAARVALTKPLNDHVSFINGTFKPKLDSIKAGIKVIKGKIATFHTEREKAEQEAVKAAAQLMGHSEEVQEIVGSASVPTRAQTAQGGSHTVKRWNYEVTDLAALARYVAGGPSAQSFATKDGDVIMGVDLLEPNKGNLRKLVNGGIREIPGVRIYQETDVAVTR